MKFSNAPIDFTVCFRHVHFRMEASFSFDFTDVYSHLRFYDVSIASHSSSRTSAILKYFCPLFLIHFFQFDIIRRQRIYYRKTKSSNFLRQCGKNQGHDRQIKNIRVFKKLIQFLECSWNHEYFGSLGR